MTPAPSIATAGSIIAALATTPGDIARLTLMAHAEAHRRFAATTITTGEPAPYQRRRPAR